MTLRWILSTLSVFGMTAPGLAANKVLYIANSYDENFFWTKEIIKGTQDELTKLGVAPDSLTLKLSFMDAFKNTTPEAMKREGDRILKQIAEAKPDYVVCTDDDAIQFVCLKLSDVPMVLNGINGVEKYLGTPQIKSKDKPGGMITGVYQTTYYKETLNLLKKLKPDAKTFAVISDKTTTSGEQIDELKQQESSLPLKLAGVHTTEKFLDWQNIAKKLESQVDVIFFMNANSIFDEGGRKVPYQDVYKWSANNVKVPGGSTWIGAVENGILVSASDAAGNQGVQTARLLHKIMKGKKPGELAFVTPPNGLPLINLKGAKVLGLTVPPNVLEIFVENGTIFHEF